MNLFRNLIILLFMCIYSLSFAQNTNQVKKRGPEDGYARSSMSYLLLDFENEKYAHYLRNAMNNTRLPSKFDNNDLSKKVIKAPFTRANSTNSTLNARKIKNTLVAQKYGVDVIKYWWGVKDDGSYSVDLIQKRGVYNATDMRFEVANSSKRGSAILGDDGLKLIKNSYVLVLDYKNVKTMKDIYDAQDAANRKRAEKDSTYKFVPVKRTQNGFKGNCMTYLFKINYPDTVQGYFDEAFIDEKKIDLAKLDIIFDKVHSPWTLVTTQSENVSAVQMNPGQPLAPGRQKSKDELAVVLVNDGIIKSLGNIEKRVAAFRVKAPVTNTDPIRAKIGTKESVTHERRFYVWEYVGNAKGNVVAKRKGVIRAWKVKNNKNDELGQTQESSFYQIGGGKITEGMTLQERKDLGIGVAAGYGGAGFVVRGDINAGLWLNAPVRQLKVYAEGIFGSKEYDEVVVPTVADISQPTIQGDEKFSLGKLSIGILKEYPFARGNFHVGWFVGWTGETVSWEDQTNSDRTDEKLSANGINWGAKFGMNLFSHAAHVAVTLNNHNYGKVTYASGVEGEESVELEEKWSDIFPERSSFSVDLSLRISF